MGSRPSRAGEKSGAWHAWELELHTAGMQDGGHETSKAERWGHELLCHVKEVV